MRFAWMRALSLAALALAGVSGLAQTVRSADAVPALSGTRPWEFGVQFQGGKGVTDNRDGFLFFAAGAHAGKVLTGEIGKGLFRGNFEYAAEVLPYWQSNTPKFNRYSCTATSVPLIVNCSPPYTVGGTFHGATVTPIILRWNFTRGRRVMPWAQAAGGLLWTNHKYPAYGQGPVNLINDGPNADASVFNFTPQGGLGVHYFVRPRQSLDLSANGVHISSASLGDRNPGVNASVQFSLGYTWWK